NWPLPAKTSDCNCPQASIEKQVSCAQAPEKSQKHPAKAILGDCASYHFLPRRGAERHSRSTRSRPTARFCPTLLLCPYCAPVQACRTSALADLRAVHTWCATGVRSVHGLLLLRDRFP